VNAEDTERAGLRERKKQETRSALSWAAVRLTVEHGLDNVRVEDIAADVGVSTRTFNNYFSSKAEAIAARHLDRAQRIAAELRARPTSESLWESITSAALAQFAAGQEVDRDHTLDMQWLAGVRLMVAEPALQGEFYKANAAAEAEFAEAIAERTGTDSSRDLYPRMMAGVVGAAITATMEHWVRAGSPVPIEPLLRDALARLAAGLPAP
jgi:AcrR family transcriptional regulator